MTSADEIRRQIYLLYRVGRRIHITAPLGGAKTAIEKVEAHIVGVYPRLFLIEEQSGGTVKRHTFKYTDVLTSQVHIAELQV